MANTSQQNTHNRETKTTGQTTSGSSATLTSKPTTREAFRPERQSSLPSLTEKHEADARKITLPPNARALHVIKKGETFSGVAKDFSVSVKALCEANPNVDPSRLQVGQRLVVPADAKITLPENARALHVIKKGETLSGVAQNYSVNLNALREANPGVNPARLSVGQTILIPKSGQQPQASPAQGAVQQSVSPQAAQKAIRQMLISQEVKLKNDGLDKYRKGEAVLETPKTEQEKQQALKHKDPAIKRLQTALREYGLAPDLPTTGYYGTQTAGVVRDIQVRFGITPDGRVGKEFMAIFDMLSASRESLRNKSVPQAKPAPQAEKAPAPPPQAPPPAASAGLLASVKDYFNRRQKPLEGPGSAAMPLAAKTILDHEGLVSNNKKDLGGFTNRGITAPFYEDYKKSKGEALSGDPQARNNAIRAITTEEAAKIYQEMIFEKNHLERLPPEIALVTADMIANHPSRAIKIVQRAAGVEDDNRLGDETVKAVWKHQPVELVRRITELRGEAYAERMRKRPDQAGFTGWFDRNEKVGAVATSPLSKEIFKFYEKNGIEDWDLMDQVRYNFIPQLDKKTGASEPTLVCTLQERLNKVNFLSPMKVDGRYGTETEKRVTAFRQHCKLPAGNHWDSACQKKLDEVLEFGTG